MENDILKEIGGRIKQFRKAAKMTQSQLADKCGASQSYIADIENGKLSPSLARLTSIAQALGVNANSLLNKDGGSKNTEFIDIPLSPATKIPVVGVIRAGESVIAEQNIIGYVDLPADLVRGDGEFFGLKVTGDSMSSDRICEGDIVIVKKQNIVENGDIAVVLIDDENATIKRFYMTNTTVTLVPHSLNPEYKPRVINPTKIPVKVLGKVVRAIINF